MSPASRDGSLLQQGSAFQVARYQILEKYGREEVLAGRSGPEDAQSIVTERPRHSAVSNRAMPGLCVDSSALHE